MKINKLILMTLSGAAMLALAPLASAQCPDKAGSWHHGHPDMTAMLSHVLQLTDAQKAQVQTLVAEVQPQLDAIHQQARAAAAPIIKQLNTQIRPLLTPDQQKKFDAFQILHGSGPGPE